MEKTEEELRQEYAEAGVDLEELKGTEEKPEEEKKEVEKPADDEPENPEKKTVSDNSEEEEEEESDLSTDTKEKPKRSIYDEYKEKKTELKTEKELRLNAEKERDELKTKLEALQNAETPKEKKEAADDLEKFAEEIQADPQALKRMQELFTKDLKGQGLSEEDRNILNQAKDILSKNKILAEKQAFQEELTAFTPTLREAFPTASEDEMQAVKKELDKLAHKANYHDKELDYVLYKEKNELAKLVSPKKRGMEGHDKKDGMETTTEFDPNADLSKMSAEELAKWEEEYRNLSKTDGLLTDASGKKLMI